MKHLRALDEDLEPVDVDSGEYHSGPQCAVCGEVNCSSCGNFDNFDTEECPGVDLADLGIEEVAALTEQLHRYAALADRLRVKVTTELNGRLLAEVAIKRLNIEVANALRGHALADAEVANALHREKLALAQVAILHADLAELRNAEPS